MLVKQALGRPGCSPVSCWLGLALCHSRLGGRHRQRQRPRHCSGGLLDAGLLGGSKGLCQRKRVPC